MHRLKQTRCHPLRHKSEPQAFRPTRAGGASIALNGYTAFNLPVSVSKSLSGAVTASAEFFHDAGYQRVRQIKRGLAGVFADDILYVVPGGFEVHRDGSGRIIKSIAPSRAVMAWWPPSARALMQ